MTPHSDPSPPSDVCLLLRAHAEQRWLSREVVPVLRELEQRDSLPEEQLGAALAYLEVIWIEAARRAAETDATYAELDTACAQLDLACAEENTLLPSRARHYHATVRTLREIAARHVARLTAIPTDGAFTHDHART
ncbi:MAG TPA: hypothetical protein VK272_08240 [Solirubrobacteraceae bacterium]|nr:hypothetical protein [Solirubrobacteraceae bacterium]